MMLSALAGLPAFLVFNPGQKEAVLHPNLCWHTHVGLTLPEWNAELAKGCLPGCVIPEGRCCKIETTSRTAGLVFRYGELTKGKGNALWWACPADLEPGCEWLPVDAVQSAINSPRVPFEKLAADAEAGSRKRRANSRALALNSRPLAGIKYICIESLMAKRKTGCPECPYFFACSKKTMPLAARAPRAQPAARARRCR
jgi:hypothetical protein